jgi:septum site-determining protein MinC
MTEIAKDQAVTPEILKHHVVIKGVKEGLVFQINDQCEWEEVLTEIQYKLENTHQKLLSGTSITVTVKLGERVIDDEQRKALQDLLAKNENLVVRAIENNLNQLELHINEVMLSNAKIIRGMIRSGQVIQHKGNVLLIGDVNPGGTIISEGDIYVLGSLRGIAHAGASGNEQAIIAASHFRPTQLRIANLISRPPDEWGVEDVMMEFAYLTDGQMNIEKIHLLQKIRPDRG